MHFHKGFVKINPKNKIFCGVDDKLSDGGKPEKVWGYLCKQTFRRSQNRPAAAGTLQSDARQMPGSCRQILRGNCRQKS